jgi:urocanate hydratase
MDKGAQENKLVVGSRDVLYGCRRPCENCSAFNQAIAKGDIGTIVLGTGPSRCFRNRPPYRDIKHLRRIAFYSRYYSKRDWRQFRGATWVSIHNGGGVGWGEGNGGFGMVLMEEAPRRLQSMLLGCQ